ncbi:hypothetical protein JXB22_00870 [candidate division WOR-3 bacterium]|nr:hypothetical protein [candidate division WOR-3 bacterium]
MLSFIYLCLIAFNQNTVDSAMARVRGVYDLPVISPGAWVEIAGWTGALERYYAGPVQALPGRSDIVVGDEPSETLSVTGYFYNNGDIIVVNDGVVRITQADFHLDGSIIAMGHGAVYVDSSSFTIHQHFIYHRILSTVDSAYFSITNTTTDFSGYQIGVNIQGWGEFVMTNVINHDWITAVVMHDASTILDHVEYTGEWLFINRCTSLFHDVNYLITWYFCEDSSIVDIAFPESDTVYGFIFDSTMANITNIDYHVEIDSSTNCIWAMIPLRGSDVTVRDSYLRVTGLMFEGVDSFSVTGLVNGLHYNDFTLPVPDRTYHLINTTVQTWNLYPSDSTIVMLTSSIFGELCGFASSFTTIQQAFCDGSGGHIEASGTATVLVVLSSIFADVITKEFGVCLLAHCSMPYGRIWATGSSVMVIVNTQFPEEPIPYDTSIVFVAAVTGPSEAIVEDTIGIIGSAWIDQGPFHPLDFDHYRLYYRAFGDSVWQPVGSEKTTEVRYDTLDHWATTGLSSGDYEVRLVLKDTAGDSVEAMKQIRLRPTGIAELPSHPAQAGLCCERISGTVYRITSVFDAPDIHIYDIAGKHVGSFRESDILWTAPSCGIYFVQEKSHQITKKVIAF